MRIEHQNHSAIQVELYLPTAVTTSAPGKAFLEKLGEIEEGATVFDQARGLWRGEAEPVRVYRFIVRQAEMNEVRLRETVKARVEALMRELASKPDAPEQDAILCTFTRVEMTITSAARRGA